MKFLKYISLFLLSFLLITCSGVRSSWKNFRAHYNSYYNAEKSFNAGLNTIDDQPADINPELPIRVHLNPPRVPEEDFENSIEKGARILRKFPDSKWTDDALLIIGKSYYYKGDYYLAIEKFEELSNLTGNDIFMQQAAIWKARSLLDLEQFEDGVSFIMGNLNADYWSPSNKAEFQILLGEHYAMLENWDQAAAHLGDALAHVEGRALKARAFFLFGQVLERLERYGEAFFAYDNVASFFPDYEYVFWSKLKKAEVARKEGNLDPALSIYISMSKDDKNFSRLDRINYEIARTLEMQGNLQQAEQGYKEILRSEYSSASRNVEAKTYYRLGKIYSESYNDFGTAAAYFDSASTRVTNISFLESNFNAQQLASAYGTYAEMKAKVNRLDSLLWLGTLRPAELDSAIQVIREQKRKSIDAELKEQQEGTNRLINIASARQAEDGINTSASEFGFLNYRNARLKQEAVNQFAAMWQNRPLVDNWRRIEVIRSTGITSAGPESVPVTGTPGAISGAEDAKLDIDLSEIPTTEEQKKELTNDLLNARYELGNLFFLTLNMPDSAEAYFVDIVRKYPNSSLVPRSMYSLFEIHSESSNKNRTEYWGNRILQQFPDSRYAEKVLARRNGNDVEAIGGDSADVLLTKVQRIEQSSDSLSPVKAEQFRRLAIANRSTNLAPFIYYRAIRTYVDLAKSITDSQLYADFLQAQNTIKSDSSTTIDGNSGSMPSPFYGAYWDSVRTVITEYDSVFTEHPHEKELNALKELLDTPAGSPRPSPDRITSASPKKPPKKVLACNELNQSIEIVGGKANFLSLVTYPDHIDRQQLTGSITYEIQINKGGNIASHRLVSSETMPEVEQAFDKAIESNLLFDPISLDGEIREVSCRISFPVDKEVPKPVSQERVTACKDFDADIEIVGGMRNFMSMINYPEEISRKELADNIVYQINITKSGGVDSFKLVSSDVPPSLEQALAPAIKNNLLFDPVVINGKVQEVRCKMSFPLQR